MHVHHWPRTPVGQTAPPHIFRRCPPYPACCSHLTSSHHRCEHVLCCSMIASSRLVLSPPPRHCGRGDDGLPGLTSPGPTTTATLPPPLRHTNSLPAQRALPAGASQGFRLSELLCGRCVAPVQLCSCFTLPPYARLPLANVQRRSDSPLFAPRHPAARFRQLRSELF